MFITIQSCPSETIQRWSISAPVTEQTLSNWQGFVRRAPQSGRGAPSLPLDLFLGRSSRVSLRISSTPATAGRPHTRNGNPRGDALSHPPRPPHSLIVNAYFREGMAWYPIARLMMVQSATLGYAEPPTMVAERMSVVRLRRLICPVVHSLICES